MSTVPAVPSLAELDGDLRLLRACLMCSPSDEAAEKALHGIARLTTLRLDLARGTTHDTDHHEETAT